jgi:hypothetical protein
MQWAATWSKEIIRKETAAGDGVIVGRGGAYLLRDQDDVLSVFDSG